MECEAEVFIYLEPHRWSHESPNDTSPPSLSEGWGDVQRVKQELIRKLKNCTVCTYGRKVQGYSEIQVQKTKYTVYRIAAFAMLRESDMQF